MCSPSGRTVRSPASPSIVVSRSPSSTETTRVSPVGLPLSLSITGASSGAISRSKRPSSTAIAGLALRLEAPRLQVLAGEAAVAGDPVGALELVGHVDRPRLRPRVARTGRDVRAQRDPAHRLHAAGDPDLDRAGLDHVVDQVRRLLAGAALGVDRGRAGGLGEPGVQPGAADHVVGLLAGLGDAAADDLLDQLGVDAGALEHLALDEPEQLARVDAGEAAVALAEGGADSVDDHGVSHGTKLEHVLIFGNVAPISCVSALPKQTESM